MIKVTDVITMVTVNCSECGPPFGVEENLHRTLYGNGKSFYCPNGHSQYYPGETDREKIKRLEREVKNERDSRVFFQGQAEEKAVDLERTRKQLSSTRGQLTKTKKRIQGGACPCCSRQFVNLARHMHTQHPDYSESDNE